MADDYAKHFPSDFPNLRNDYKKRSDPADHYNCIAWAALECDSWWEPRPDAYWPLPIMRDYALDYSVQNYVRAFELMGYEACISPHREKGFQKIAIYGEDGIATHAARQTWRGFWVSKLGPNVDIRHESLELLEAGIYGRVAQIMKRPWTVCNLLKSVKLSIRVSYLSRST
jgi:hypothetical protein